MYRVRFYTRPFSGPGDISSKALQHRLPRPLPNSSVGRLPSLHQSVHHEIEADPLPDIETVVAFTLAIPVPRCTNGFSLKPYAAEAIQRGLDAGVRPACQGP